MSARYSVRTILKDGTQHYEWPDGEEPARRAYSGSIRNATPATARVELRRHETDGTITVLTSKEGTWRTH